MTDLSLPLDHFKKAAKTLKKSVEASTPDACARVRSVYKDSAEKTDAEIAADFGLMRAQHIIAKEHGFDSWDALIKASPIEARLAITMERIPELNDFGIGLYGDHYKKPKHEQQAIYEKNRADLRGAVDPVQRTVEWLQENVEPIKTINPKRSSYGIKHLAEKDLGYITNGMFIAAGIIAGYEYKIEPGSPNVSFAMSEKSLKDIAKRRLKAERSGVSYPAKLEFFEAITTAIQKEYPDAKVEMLPKHQMRVRRAGTFFAFCTPWNVPPEWPVVGVTNFDEHVGWRTDGWECENIDDILTVLRWPQARPSEHSTSVNQIRDDFENPSKHVWLRARHRHPTPEPIMTTWECSGCDARVYLPFGEKLETYVRYGYENWRDRGEPRSSPPSSISNSMTVAAIPPQCPKTKKLAAAPVTMPADPEDSVGGIDPYEASGIDPYAPSAIDPYAPSNIDPYAIIDEQRQRPDR